jgi:hypothetical protein
MKHLITILLLCAAGLTSKGTQIFFPLLEMTGTTNDTIITVRAVNNPVIWNGSFHYLPAAGTNLTTSGGYVTNSFVPGNYTASVRGLAKSWTIYVTNSATALSAVDLSREVVRYSGIQTLTGSGIQVTNDGLGNLTITQTNTSSTSSTLWTSSGGAIYPSGDTGTAGGWTATATAIYPE